MILRYFMGSQTEIFPPSKWPSKSASKSPPSIRIIISEHERTIIIWGYLLWFWSAKATKWIYFKFFSMKIAFSIVSSIQPIWNDTILWQISCSPSASLQSMRVAAEKIQIELEERKQIILNLKRSHTIWLRLFGKTFKISIKLISLTNLHYFVSASVTPPILVIDVTWASY